MSCQTIARVTGRPVARSQTTVVSRWLAMPRATTSPALDAASRSAWAAVRWVFAQISIGSCSTQPGRGNHCRCSRWRTDTIRPPRSKTMDRVDVVPWSTAST